MPSPTGTISRRRDFDRGLNERGQRGAAANRVAHRRPWAWQCDAAIASPAERVRRTIEASSLGIAPTFDERLYLADAATLMAVLRDLSRRSRQRAAGRPQSRPAGPRPQPGEARRRRQRPAGPRGREIPHRHARRARTAKSIRGPISPPAAPGWSISPGRATSIPNSDRSNLILRPTAQGSAVCISARVLG